LPAGPPGYRRRRGRLVFPPPPSPITHGMKGKYLTERGVGAVVARVCKFLAGQSKRAWLAMSYYGAMIALLPRQNAAR
jgi:hypothetical protein